MQPDPTARRAAYDVRRQTSRGRRLDRAFAAVAGRLDPRDRAFVHELTYGTTRLQGRVDHLIGRHVDRGLASLDAEVLEVLRLGAYQALYMGAVPGFAAVSSSVDLAREVAGPKPTGLVNAVLRRVADDGDSPSLFPDPARDPVGYLEAWGSHPRWLLDRWLERAPYDEVAALVEANNRRPATYLTSLELEEEAVAARLRQEGFEAETTGVGAVRLASGTPPAHALEAVPGGIVQDPAAGLVARYADVPEGHLVVDLCAAPGGKALALTRRAGYVVAADRSEPRIRLVQENVHRTGRSVGLLVADALRPPLSMIGIALLDVPCSGTGTLARHPDARWRLRPESIETFTMLQARMLDAAASVVAPGGLLIYSTCTLEPEENVDRIEAFLGKHPDFRVESTGTPASWLDASGLLTVTPQSSGFDGAFAARMRRAD